MPTLRKAILLAAGRGSRLGSLTAHTPKPLLEVAGAPLLAHIVEGLSRAGLEQFLIVTGYLGEQLDAFCTRFGDEHHPLRLRTVRQPSLNGTAGAMLAALPAIEGEPGFIFGWGDVLMEAANYQHFVSEARAANYDLLLAVNRMADPYRGAAVYVDQRMVVTRLVEKPPLGTSTTNWNNAGLFAATPKLFGYLKRLHRSAREELELPAAIAAMVADGLQVRAIEVNGFWSDIGTPDELASARERFKPSSAQL